MKFVPNFVQKIIWKFNCFALTKQVCLSKWFNSKYFFLFELLTLKSVLLSNKLVRKYIVLKGKDPDYAAPAPLPIPPPEPTIEEILNKHGIFSTRGKSTNMFGGYKYGWVKNPSTHPVLKARAAFKESQRVPVFVPEPAPLEVTLHQTEAVETPSEPVENPFFSASGEINPASLKGALEKLKEYAFELETQALAQEISSNPPSVKKSKVKTIKTSKKRN